jgi:hypothetical protein
LDKSQGETAARHAKRQADAAAARFAEVASTMMATPHPRCADCDGELEAESEEDEISQPALRMQGSSDSSLRRNRIQATLWAFLGRRAAVHFGDKSGRECLYLRGGPDRLL